MTCRWQCLRFGSLPLNEPVAHDLALCEFVFQAVSIMPVTGQIVHKRSQHVTAHAYANTRAMARQQNNGHNVTCFIFHSCKCYAGVSINYSQDRLV